MERQTLELVSQRTENSIEAQRQATRSGEDMVPPVIRIAGPRALESYLCFFAQFNVKGRTASYGYISAAKRFLGWCHEHGLSLENIGPGHVTTFFAAMKREWKNSTASVYFHGLRRLFAHLESDRVIERSPFVGIKAPRATMTVGELSSLKVLREEVAEIVRPADERSVEFRAGLVTLFPLFFDGEMNVARISEVTRIPAEEVSVYVSRLRNRQIWTPDNGIEFDGSLENEAETYLNLVLMVGCAAGQLQRQKPEEVLP